MENNPRKLEKRYNFKYFKVKYVDMPSQNEESEFFFENLKKDGSELLKKVKRYPLISICFIIALLILIIIPYAQVDHQEISNNTERANLENQYRATLAQILGGAAIGISLYYTWKRIGIAEEELRTTQGNLKVTQEIAQNNLKTSQEGQINERFTRAVDQLGAIDQKGNPAIEIRLGGIYALERISKESDEDYWPIIEILTAYVRKNSPPKGELIGNDQSIEPISMDIQNLKVIKLPLDIEAIARIIGRRKNNFEEGEPKPLNLKEVCFQGADISYFNLSGADISYSNLSVADLRKANFSGAKLLNANLSGADISCSNLSGADLRKANLSWAKLRKANLSQANLYKANLTWADLREANFSGAYIADADLKKAELDAANLTGVDLTDTNLSGASLQTANFTGANLYNADLTGANLYNADLTGVDLTHANLTGIQMLSIDQLSKVKALGGAELDMNLRKQLEDKYPDRYRKLNKSGRLMYPIPPDR